MKSAPKVHLPREYIGMFKIEEGMGKRLCRTDPYNKLRTVRVSSVKSEVTCGHCLMMMERSYGELLEDKKYRETGI